MLNKNIFYLNSKKFYKNLEKTKTIFNSLKQDLINSAIPLLQCYEKNYIFDFTPTTIKKFSKFKNIVIVGMGGSILGTKSIYSFFKSKIKTIKFWYPNWREYFLCQ